MLLSTRPQSQSPLDWTKNVDQYFPVDRLFAYWNMATGLLWRREKRHLEETTGTQVIRNVDNSKSRLYYIFGTTEIRFELITRGPFRHPVTNTANYGWQTWSRHRSKYRRDGGSGLSNSPTLNSLLFDHWQKHAMTRWSTPIQSDPLYNFNVMTLFLFWNI